MLKQKLVFLAKSMMVRIINIPYKGPSITAIQPLYFGPILFKKVIFRVSFEENRNGKSKKDFSLVEEIRLKESG